MSAKRVNDYKSQYRQYLRGKGSYPVADVYGLSAVEAQDERNKVTDEAEFNKKRHRQRTEY